MLWLGFAESARAQRRAAQNLPQDAEERGEAFLLNLLPWGISLLAHAAMVLIAIWVVWSVHRVIEKQDIIVPTARLSETPGAPLQVRQRTTSEDRSRSATRSSTLQRSSLSRSASRSSSSIASTVSQRSLAIGSAGGQAGAGSPFDVGVQVGEGLKAKFFGTGGNAYRLVYLVDASGSLIDTLPFVIDELKRSIGALSEKQSFTVIFFQGQEPVEVQPRGMKRASADNKQRIISYISLENGNVIPGGRSSPVQAINLALQYKPDLIFILSDDITGSGQYEVDQRRLLREVERANTNQTKINTIQFLYPDPLTEHGMTGTLERIAEMSGGQHKFLQGRDLNIE